MSKIRIIRCYVTPTVNSFARTPEILWMTQHMEPTGEQSQLTGDCAGSFDYTIAEAAIQQGCLAGDWAHPQALHFAGRCSSGFVDF
jgi:hypothetical protein